MFETETERYDDPDVMDEGGSVESTTPKTRKPRTVKPKDSGSGAGPKATDDTGPGLHLLVKTGEGGAVVQITEYDKLRMAAAEAILHPDDYKLFKAQQIEPDSVFQK